MKKEIIVSEKKIIRTHGGKCELLCDYLDAYYSVDKFFCKLLRVTETKITTLETECGNPLCCPACIEAQKSAEGEN